MERAFINKIVLRFPNIISIGQIVLRELPSQTSLALYGILSYLIPSIIISYFHHRMIAQINLLDSY